MDIKLIPTTELIADREESIEDIKVCKKALEIGVTKYSGGGVLERLKGNENIIKVIDAEVSQRQNREEE